MKKIITLMTLVILLASCSNKPEQKALYQEFSCFGGVYLENSIGFTELLEMNTQDGETVDEVYNEFVFVFDEYFEANGVIENEEERIQFMETYLVNQGYLQMLYYAQINPETDEHYAGVTSSFLVGENAYGIGFRKDTKQFDYDLLNQNQYFSGYDREVKSLFYQEELEALKNNSYECEVFDVPTYFQ